MLDELAAGLMTATANTQVAVIISHRNGDALQSTVPQLSGTRRFTNDPAALTALMLSANPDPAIDCSFQVASALLVDSKSGERPTATKRIITLTDGAAALTAGPPAATATGATQAIVSSSLAPLPDSRRDLIDMAAVPNEAADRILVGGGGRILDGATPDARRSALNQLVAPAFSRIINADWQDQLGPAFALAGTPKLDWLRVTADDQVAATSPPAYSASAIQQDGSSLSVGGLTLASSPTFRDGFRITYDVILTLPYKDGTFWPVSTATRLTVPTTPPWFLYYQPVAAKGEGALIRQTITITQTIVSSVNGWKIALDDHSYYAVPHTPPNYQPGGPLAFSDNGANKFTIALSVYLNHVPIQYTFVAKPMINYVTTSDTERINDLSAQKEIAMTLTPKTLTLSWEVPKAADGSRPDLLITRGTDTKTFSAQDSLAVKLPTGNYTAALAAPSGFTSSTIAFQIIGNKDVSVPSLLPAGTPPTPVLTLKSFTLTGALDWANARLYGPSSETATHTSTGFSGLAPGRHELMIDGHTTLFTLTPSGTLTAVSGGELTAELTPGPAANQLELTNLTSGTLVLPTTGGHGGLVAGVALLLITIGLIQRRNPE
ncbi:hypothetical protein [Lacticaseibacillus kribbianus]|uniref:hypothetical protein n=1 Tax=Lacticaseibacillus kribbianus TaxID=2926292 RepID=UPI001CD3D58C|nr:hypothetical protein [Lacticaseibacillus kribbianus]